MIHFYPVTSTNTPLKHDREPATHERTAIEVDESSGGYLAASNIKMGGANTNLRDIYGLAIISTHLAYRRPLII
jgi:hypothetical protein